MQKHQLLQPLFLFAFLLSIYGFLSGCQKEENQISEKFVNLYVDLKLVTISNEHNTQKASTARKKILMQYNYTQEDYNSQLENLISNDALWQTFLEKVIKRTDQALKIHKGD